MWSDFSWCHLLVPPPSGFILVFVKVLYRFTLDSFDCVLADGFILRRVWKLSSW